MTDLARLLARQPAGLASLGKCNSFAQKFTVYCVEESIKKNSLNNPVLKKSSKIICSSFRKCLLVNIIETEPTVWF